MSDREEKLSLADAASHLAALMRVAIAAAVIMTPAAYHRIRGVTHVGDRFIDISSRLLLIGLAPLALGLSLDVFILGKLVPGVPPLAGVMAAGVFGVVVFMWYFFPRVVDGRRGHA